MTAIRPDRAPSIRDLGLLAMAYATFAIAFTWPTAARLDELGLLAVSEPFDSLIFLWNFQWVGDSLRAGTSPLWTDRLFFPSQVPLMLHTSTLFYALLSVPIQMLFEGGRGLHIAYHLCVLGSFTAAGLATWALARRQGLSTTGAFLAGVAFAYCGARVTNLARLHVLCSELVPIAMLALIWTLEERRLRGPILLATGMTLLAYNSATLLTISATGLVVFLAGIWKRREPGWAGRLIGAAVATMLMVSPLVPGVVEGLGWSGWPGWADSERFSLSLDLAALVWPNANDLLLGPILPTRPINPLEEYFSFFIGVPVALLALAAVWLRAPIARRGAWLAVGATGLVLALGPEAKWLEQPLGIPLPYDFLHSWLPPLRVSRVPARFVVLPSLVLALWAGAGLDAVGRNLRLGARSTAALCALLSIGVALDGTDGFPLKMLTALEPHPHLLARALEPLPARSAVLDLPYDDYYARRFAMYYQTEHHHPILFAAYPRAPRSNREHFAGSALFEVLSNPEVDAETLAAQLAALDLASEREALRARGIGAIVLHHEMWKLGSESVRSERIAQGRVIARSLAAAWGPPERIPVGFYAVVLFRL